MKKILTAILTLCLCCSLFACGSKHTAETATDPAEISDGVDIHAVTEGANPSAAKSSETGEANGSSEPSSRTAPPEAAVGSANDMEDTGMQLTVGNRAVTVDWEDNGSVEALMALCADAPLTIQMSMYGGFEQVGSIGKSLPRSDRQITTQAGDIVLYSGDRIVIFYGSNSWSYTRLGRITDLSSTELSELLGNGDVSITISNQ